MIEKDKINIDINRNIKSSKKDKKDKSKAIIQTYFIYYYQNSCIR